MRIIAIFLMMVLFSLSCVGQGVRPIIVAGTKGAEAPPVYSFDEFYADMTNSGNSAEMYAMWVMIYENESDSRIDRIGNNDLTDVNGGLTYSDFNSWLADGTGSLNTNFNFEAEGVPAENLFISLWILQGSTSGNNDYLFGAEETATNKVWIRELFTDQDIRAGIGSQNKLWESVPIIAGNLYSVGRQDADTMALYVNGVLKSKIQQAKDTVPDLPAWIYDLNKNSVSGGAWEGGRIGLAVIHTKDMDMNYVAARFEALYDQANIPAIPQNVVATAVSSSQVNVTWDLQATAAYYNVIENNVFMGQVATNQTGVPFAHFGLDEETIYEYQVQAVSAGGHVSELSAADTALTPSDPVVSLAAFPGAMGFGKYTQGGRGGQVFFVDNLNNSGAGSFRQAAEVETGPRYIIFRVGGTITLNSSVNVKKFATIAGQTAPGDGIMITGYPVTFDDEGEYIARGLRVRIGNENRDCITGNCDAIQIQGTVGENVIIDHSSVSWATDGNLDIVARQLGGQNYTIQNCIIAETLEPHSLQTVAVGWKNFGVGPVRVSYVNNYIAHGRGRNPQYANSTTGEMMGNVIYNWQGQASTAEDGVVLNFISNYYKAGPSTANNKELKIEDDFGDGVTQVYPLGNIGPNRPLDSDPQDALIFETTGIVNISGTPVIVSNDNYTLTAEQSRDYVLANVGAWPRDAVDTRLINDFINGTGQIIDDETTVGPAVSSLVYNSDTYPTDTDGDGIPDYFEINVLGTDHTSATGANGANGDHDSDGYENIEEYINSFFDILFINESFDSWTGTFPDERPDTYSWTLANNTAGSFFEESGSDGTAGTGHLHHSDDGGNARLNLSGVLEPSTDYQAIINITEMEDGDFRFRIFGGPTAVNFDRATTGEHIIPFNSGENTNIQLSSNSGTADYVLSSFELTIAPPEGPAPEVQSVTAIDPNRVRVVFDKNVDNVSASRTSFDFDGTSAGNNIVATSVTGLYNVYDFAFTGANFVQAETINMDYSGGTVVSRSGLQTLATVTDQAVTNLVDPLAFANDEPTVTTIWSTTDWLDSNMGFGDNSTHHSFMMVGDTAYIVWVEADERRPMVAKVAPGGGTTTEFLDAADYFAEDDSHNRFSIGISSDGYIHVSGDMHAYRWGEGASDITTYDHMPARYQNKMVMYWVSDAPWDISAFTWHGDSTDTMAPKGFAYTYQKFEKHPDGTLFYEARNRVYDGGHGDGETGESMWRYEPDTRTWTRLGAIPSTGTAEPATQYAIVHIDGSQDKGSSPEFYQGMESDITIDPWGRIHVAVTGALGTDQPSSNRLMYGYSDDKGDTWFKADGTQISMPITPSTGDVVVSAAVGDMPSVAAMPNGHPIITYNDLTGGGSGNREYAYWTGSSWNTGNDAPTNGTTKDFVHVGPDGMFTWIRHNSDDIRREKWLGQGSWLRNQDEGTCCMSDHAFIENGGFYLLTINAGTLALKKIEWGIGAPSIY